MALLDWMILSCFIAFMVVVAYLTKKYARGVADFLTANRCAGKYILAMGDGMVTLGAISFVACFQLYYEGGFTPIWWESTRLPLYLFVAISSSRAIQTDCDWKPALY